MSELAGKRALVTGGSRGIGAAIALELAQRGADVALTYERSAERASEVVRAIEAEGRRALAIQADSADPAALKRSVDAAAGALGGLDILVNNAAVCRTSALADVSVEHIDLHFNVNVRGPVLASQAALAHLGVGGRIVNIGSIGADRDFDDGLAVYYMTKAALQAFTRGLAREVGPRDITVNLVQPGPTDTDMNPAQGDQADRARAMMPLGRYGTGEDVAGLVAFLAGPGAKHITGAGINVDGGLMA